MSHEFETGFFVQTPPWQELVPDERVPVNENRFYGMLDVYAPAVSRVVKQSLLPRVVAPWPGGKHIYLVGTTGTGKSVLIAMCRRLVDGHVCSIAGHRKSDWHASTRMENAFINYVPEANRVIKNLASWKDEADREVVEINPKGKTAYMARYMCTPLVAANLLPPLPIFGSEMWRRILPIPFMRRLKGVAGLGDDKVNLMIAEITEAELDSVWSDAADIAAKAGPNGIYPGDPTDRATEIMYAQLTEPLRIFMQGMIKWNDAGGKLLVSDILKRYRASEYALLDSTSGLKDERKDRVLQTLALRIGISMGGTPSRHRTESCHNGKPAIAGLSWGNEPIEGDDVLTEFLVMPDSQDVFEEPAKEPPTLPADVQ